jgi:hypothetical protein
MKTKILSEMLETAKVKKYNKITSTVSLMLELKGVKEKFISLMY